MGAFHEGHVTLMRTAREECDTAAVSLFVNPTQFGPGEDLARYPRREAQDLEMAHDAGVDVVFAPTAAEMYPRSTTSVIVREVSEPFEGERRPGHFEGVATIVLKLFNLFSPNRAYFGLKDLQQCAVIRRMIDDLNVNIDLRLVETVREQSGLAMSSRHAYLSAEARDRAAALFAQLMQVAGKLREGERSEEACAQGAERLRALGFDVEYLACVDPVTMESVSRSRPGDRVVVAARLEGVRLIDNVPV
jgi:pantoate--beta-alanine ligase